MKMLVRVYVCIILFILKISTTNALCPDPPHGCPRDKIAFFLYTAKDKPYELILDDPNSFINAPVLPNTDFKFIIHGYLESVDCPIMVDLRNAYFDEKPWNIIYIDYSKLAKNPCYTESTFPSVPQIGTCASDMLNVLLKNREEIKIEQFHVIGFSMGAQISAQLSNHLKPLVLNRISALDPAYPGFTPGFSKGDNILNKQHAIFVDAIHSNMGILGVFYSAAHYDIYANDGTFQPGCSIDDLPCSHTRALQIFIASINAKDDRILANKCKDDWLWLSIRKCNGDKKKQIVVGEHCLPPASEKEEGIYKFTTSDKPPFTRGPPEP